MKIAGAIFALVATAGFAATEIDQQTAVLDTKFPACAKGDYRSEKGCRRANARICRAHVIEISSFGEFGDANAIERKCGNKSNVDQNGKCRPFTKEELKMIKNKCKDVSFPHVLMK